VILHEAVEQHLVLVSERSEEGVLEDDRGLLRWCEACSCGRGV
jgi:hypothetical protein